MGRLWGWLVAAERWLFAGPSAVAETGRGVMGEVSTPDADTVQTAPVTPVVAGFLMRRPASQFRLPSRLGSISQRNLPVAVVPVERPVRTSPSQRGRPRPQRPIAQTRWQRTSSVTSPRRKPRSAGRCPRA